MTSNNSPQRVLWDAIPEGEWLTHDEVVRLAEDPKVLGLRDGSPAVGWLLSGDWVQVRTIHGRLRETKLGVEYREPPRYEYKRVALDKVPAEIMERELRAQLEQERRATTAARNAPIDQRLKELGLLKDPQGVA